MIRQIPGNAMKVFNEVSRGGHTRWLNALVLGSGGRLGKILTPEMQKSGMNVFSNTREITGASESAIGKSLVENRIDVIVNTAVVSEGSREEMQAVNVELPSRVAKAAQVQGIPFIQVSSTATQVSGVGPSMPYADSKRDAENELLEMNNSGKIKIARLDALVGGSARGKIDISYMMRAGVALHFKGISPIFQPTSYRATSIGLTNMALACADPDRVKSVPSVVNFAGAPISISDFVRMLDEKAIELHVNPLELLAIADVVQNGSLTPEFLLLAISSGKDPKIHCNADFIDFLGDEKLPTTDDLIMDIRNQSCPLEFLKSACEIVRNISDKPRLVREVAKLAYSSVVSPSGLSMRMPENRVLSS
ncbi:MAG: sugar nucleotide-binding protein [Rhabdochlamydiaceae bacterium]|nr:sugar nucleotide-binding protein [Rhabdochlamydiaceae bacterium]